MPSQSLFPLLGSEIVFFNSNIFIFDRELCSKVLKEASLLLLFLFLGLAGNHEQKMFQIKQKMCKGTKKVHGNKKCASEQKNFIKASLVHYGLVWLYVALYGLVRPCTALFTLYGVICIWSYMVLHGLFMVLYGKISKSLDLYRLFSRS